MVIKFQKLAALLISMILATGAVQVVLAEAPAAGNATPQQQQNGENQIEDFKTRQKNLQLEIKKGRREIRSFIRKENKIIRRLNQVDQSLNDSRKQIAALRKEIQALDEKLSEATAASIKLKKRIQSNEKYVAQRLVAMYKLNQLGKFHLLASAGSIHEFIQRRAALEHILAHDEEIRRELVQDQRDLKKMLVELKANQNLKMTRAAEYKAQQESMLREQSIRQNLLADIRSQKTLELAAIDALTRAANDLDGKLKSLRNDMQRAAAQKNMANLSFSAHKGLLIIPVKGKITASFGPYKNRKYNITNFRSGIDIKADMGEPIRSVFRGKVLYSNWFKGYGNMMIIDHGSNYYTIYAHLEETFKSKGDAVATHEVIATVGDTGSLEGAKLYFEVRHHGKPENPLVWLKKG